MSIRAVAIDNDGKWSIAIPEFQPERSMTVTDAIVLRDSLSEAIEEAMVWRVYHDDDPIEGTDSATQAEAEDAMHDLVSQGGIDVNLLAVRRDAR